MRYRVTVVSRWIEAVDTVRRLGAICSKALTGDRIWRICIRRLPEPWALHVPEGKGQIEAGHTARTLGLMS